MRNGSRGRVPLPTVDEMAEAFSSEREIDACCILKKGPMTFLKCGFRSGDTATVALSLHGATALLAALKGILQDTGHIDASPVNEENGGIFYVQSGYMSDVT